MHYFSEEFHLINSYCLSKTSTGLILGLRPANERRRYFVTTSLIGWAQASNQPSIYVSANWVVISRRVLSFWIQSTKPWSKSVISNDVNIMSNFAVDTVSTDWLAPPTHLQTESFTITDLVWVCDCTVEVWEWISDFIPHFTGQVVTCPCSNWN